MRARRRRPLASPSLVAALAALVVAAARAAWAEPSLDLERTFVTDGVVRATAVVGETLHLGGQFRYLGQRSGPVALLAPDSGLRIKAIAEAGGGPVRAIVPDGAGGYYL